MASGYKPSDKSFGSVFKSARRGGPRTEHSAGLDPDLLNGRLPTWQDRRRPGNTNSNEDAEKILNGWDDKKMQRFEVFMSQFYRDMTPWKKEYLDKTASNFTKPETDILKCKMELIKRLLKIKVIGPESLEDWCLLFLYHENDLDIPKNVEQLLRPDTAEMEIYPFSRPLPLLLDNPPYFIAPSENTIRYMSNMPLPGFGTVDYENSGRPKIKRTDAMTTPDIQQIAAHFPRGTQPPPANRQIMTGRTGYSFY